MAGFVELPFNVERIDIKDLVVPDAACFAASASSLPFVHFLDCFRAPEGLAQEIVLLEVDVERPQQLLYPIENKERLAVIFTPGGGIIPEVLALRSDFPQVPHLNLRPFELPKSLCLYGESSNEVMLRWTPLLFIERIRQWLNLTAKGQLHQDDQPLEPLLLSSAGTIIIPNDIYAQLTSAKDLPIFVRRISGGDEPDWMLVAEPADNGKPQEQPPFVAMGFRRGSTTHGVIRREPSTLLELAFLVKDSGPDLIAEIRTRLIEWYRRHNQVSRYSKSRPILIITLPKTRKEGGAAEELEVWAFACQANLKEVGVALGVWGVSEGRIGLYLSPDETKRGETIHVLPLKTVPSFTRVAAAKLSGLDAPDNKKIVLVGVGALGSHLLLNAIRAGFGQWTLVDNDRLLPHNLARHALDGRAVGHFKAECLSLLANNMIDGSPISVPIITDYLMPGKKLPELSAAIDNANAIVDASASLSVARHLALDLKAIARRASAFFTPTGNASVLLLEDEGRLVPLDILEMQYYREILHSAQLGDHLTDSGHPLRYGQSCRDLTSRMPQDIVTLHAALSSHALKMGLGQPTAFGGVWTLDTHTHQVSFTCVHTSPLVQMAVGNWHVRTDQAFLDKLFELRAGKLPNETGGVILGTYDMVRKIVYLVDTIPSPPDSTEWPTVYIRGCKGLGRAIKQVDAKTAGNLEYVGEWHSHPDGSTVMPSTDDMKAFEWLSDNMWTAGLPPLMIIVGPNRRAATFIEAMKP